MSDKIHNLFPCPVYIVKRESEYTHKEEKEIEDICKNGISKNESNSTSINTYIFDTKLKNIKEFCEQQIKRYVEKVICPKKEELDFYITRALDGTEESLDNRKSLDFYITQSWLNVNRPGEYHHEHSHNNSIISGVFYISTEEDDKITFIDPNIKVKDLIRSENEVANIWNSSSWDFPSNNNELFLFPSWLNHRVGRNLKATTDRISLSFNTFVRGTLGSRESLTETILK